MNDGMVSIFKEATVKRVVDIDHPVIKGDSEIYELFIGRNVYNINSTIHVITDSLIRIDLANGLSGLSISIHDDAFNYNGEYIRFTTTDDKSRRQSISDLYKDVKTATWNDTVINKDNVGKLFQIDSIRSGESKYKTKVGVLMPFNDQKVNFLCITRNAEYDSMTSFTYTIKVSDVNSVVVRVKLLTDDIKFF